MIQDNSAVLTITYSRDGNYIATGSQNGMIKIWKISTGQCLRKFNQAHQQGITSVSFAKDGTQLLSTSFDQTARIHGLKSGKTLKEFRGHTSYVNAGLYSKKNINNIFTCSADGTVKLWDTRTTECLVTIRPGVDSGTMTAGLREVAINSIEFMPNKADQLFICTQSSNAYIIDVSGKVLKTLDSGKLDKGFFTCASVSPQGNWSYCLDEDGELYIFDNKKGRLESLLRVSSMKDAGALKAMEIQHHPHRNLLATISEKGAIKFWKP